MKAEKKRAQPNRLFMLTSMTEGIWDELLGLQPTTLQS